MSDATYIEEPGGPGDDPLLAAEYALHLLSPQDRNAFEARLATSGALRAELARWEEHFSGLAARIPEIAPPPDLRARLIQQIGPEPPRRVRRGSRFSFGRFLGGGLGGLAAAAAAVIVLALALPQITPPYSGPLYTAEVAAEDGSLVVQARFDPRDDTLQLTRIAGEARADRALELWLIAEDAEAPVSLGVLPVTPETSVTLPGEFAAEIESSVLAISDEPEGGSPTGAPTGDILATGPVTEI